MKGNYFITYFLLSFMDSLNKDSPHRNLLFTSPTRKVSVLCNCTCAELIHHAGSVLFHCNVFHVGVAADCLCLLYWEAAQSPLCCQLSCASPPGWTVHWRPLAARPWQHLPPPHQAEDDQVVVGCSPVSSLSALCCLHHSYLTNLSSHHSGQASVYYTGPFPLSQYEYCHNVTLVTRIRAAKDMLHIESRNSSLSVKVKPEVPSKEWQVEV